MLDEKADFVHMGGDQSPAARCRGARRRHCQGVGAHVVDQRLHRLDDHLPNLIFPAGDAGGFAQSPQQVEIEIRRIIPFRRTESDTRRALRRPQMRERIVDGGAIGKQNAG